MEGGNEPMGRSLRWLLSMLSQTSLLKEPKNFAGTSPRSLSPRKRVVTVFLKPEAGTNTVKLFAATESTIYYSTILMHKL